ncbi:hypothetical protein GCM10009646_87270 [Streptomyces aureus]
MTGEVTAAGPGRGIGAFTVDATRLPGGRGFTGSMEMISRRTLGKVVGTGAVAASTAGLSVACSTSVSGENDYFPQTVEQVKENLGFGALKQVKAGVLNVGYAELGPTHGPAVVLLHGWPYDIHSYVAVAPLLRAIA